MINARQIETRSRVIEAVTTAGQLNMRRAAYLAGCSVALIRQMVAEGRLKIVGKETATGLPIGERMRRVPNGMPIVEVIR